MAIIQCPGCGQQVPDFNANCQFCGAMLKGNPQVRQSKTIQCPSCDMILKDTTENCPGCGASTIHLARSTRDITGFSYGGPVPPFAWPLYYVISAYWVLSGIAAIAFSAMSKDGIDIFSAMCPGFQVLLGIGLLLRLEIFRGIVNFLCWCSILGGLFTVIGSLLGMSVFGAMAIPFLLMGLLQIVTSALMIWVIGLTQTRVNDI
jgi:ribosomal protein S27E